MAFVTAAVTGALKGAGSVAGKQVVQILAKRTQRPRVALAVSKEAKAEGITVSWRQLWSWLNSKEVRIAVAYGGTEPLAQAIGRLGLDQAVGARLVNMIRDESLRRMPNRDARVTQTRRLEDAIGSPGRQQRPLLTSGGDAVAFTSALGKLHPWRADSAKELADQWSPLRPLVITLAGAQERRELLQQWADVGADALEGMPAEGWCWLACVASDYGAEDAAIEFVDRGVRAGAPASYWWARAGLTVGGGSPENAARARQLWARSVPKHPMAAAGEAIENGDYVTAQKLLAAWNPEGANDRSIKAILQTAAAAGSGDIDRAIAIGIAAAAELPEGSGNTLRTAEALLSRGHHRLSEHPLTDFAQAYDLAIQARDSRRAWLGDSVAPILTAVKASVLATNIDQAWRLTQAAPEGTALPREARDVRLQRESAVLAATMGRFDNAQTIADALGDRFVSATVEGWKALADGQHEQAEAAWLRAWDSAPDAAARLQTASALAPLGKSLPDLDSLPADYSQAVAKVRTTHEVMSSDNAMSLLRVRAADSVELTVLLAERLMAQGDGEAAATTLEAAGIRWSDPLMMRMAASRYENAGKYAKAYEVASTALSLGGTSWAGRLETLMIQFDALESMGEFSRSLAVARELVTLAPGNLTVRWALVHSLVRDGKIEDAWRALKYQGKPVDPRDVSDARTWISLAAECDDSPEFVQYSLEMMKTWTDEPDLVAVFLIQIYRGLNRYKREVTDADIAELHKATEEFADANPENQIFRRVTLDENDPLGSLTALQKEQAADPAVAELRERIQRGEIPLGFATEVASCTYVEACIKTGAGLVYSRLPASAALGSRAADAALDGRVVIDASAASTLSLLDQGVADTLVGSFLALETTDSAFRDALGAQQSLNMLSTMTVGWDAKTDRPVVTETGLGDAQAFSTRGDRVVALMTRSERRSWPGLKRFTEFAGDGTWLTALDLATAEGRAFWCDDRSLRQLATSEGTATFGTVDLLDSLEAAGRIDPELGAAVRAALVSAYHVDLEFDLRVMTHAAELDGWMPKGAAATLARRYTWAHPDECVRFAATAMGHNALSHPLAVAHWAAAAGFGLIRITDGDTEGAAGNLQIFLTHVLAQPWLRPDTLPFVIQGIRTAVEELPGTADPLPAVLTQTYTRAAARHGAPQAAEFLLMLVARLGDDDRATAARIILTT